jgi:hypothetical protein
MTAGRSHELRPDRVSVHQRGLQDPFGPIQLPLRSTSGGVRLIAADECLMVWGRMAESLASKREEPGDHLVVIAAADLRADSCQMAVDGPLFSLP